MLTVCWSPKGGSGTSVVAASVALQIAETTESVLVDLGGDQPALLGVDGIDRPGISEWLVADDDVPAEALRRLESPVGQQLQLLPRGSAAVGLGDARLGERLALAAAVFESRRSQVVVDAGSLALGDRWWPTQATTITVVRSCYLGLRRLLDADVPRTDRLVVIEEPGRALRPADIAAGVGPISARVPWDPAVARAVDAGLLSHRVPRSLRPLRAVVRDVVGLS